MLGEDGLITRGGAIQLLADGYDGIAVSLLRMGEDDVSRFFYLLAGAFRERLAQMTVERCEEALEGKNVKAVDS